MPNTPLTYSTSAALLFTEQELGGPCTEVESFPSPGNTGSIVIAQGNGDRVGLLMLNIGLSDAFIAVSRNPGINTGIRLVSQSGFFSCNVRDDFTLPSREWSAIGVAGTTIYVLEIIRFTSLAVG